MRFFYPAGQFFCQFDGHHWTWYSDYQSRWNAAVPKLTKLLKERKILGFVTGDEAVDKGLSTDHWETIINTIRSTFPRGKAILYTNDYICGGDVSPASKCINHIPPALDWISSATYRTDQSSGFVDSIRDSYNDHIFPKLASHQKVGIIPQTEIARDICDDGCMAQLELQDAKEFMAWAKSDSRVALITPYLWNGGTGTGLQLMSHADDLKKYWQDYGRSTKHTGNGVLNGA